MTYRLEYTRILFIYLLYSFTIFERIKFARTAAIGPDSRSLHKWFNTVYSGFRKSFHHENCSSIKMRVLMHLRMPRMNRRHNLYSMTKIIQLWKRINIRDHLHRAKISFLAYTPPCCPCKCKSNTIKARSGNNSQRVKPNMINLFCKSLTAKANNPERANFKTYRETEE